MFSKLTAAAVLAASLFAASGASASVLVEYSLDGSLANSGTGSATIQNNGSLGATGITFAANQGPTVSGLGPLGTYTIETAFRFDNLGSYRKIVDFLGNQDTGLYASGTSLAFYNFVSSPAADFSAGDMVRVVLTRDASSLVTGYVDGVQRLSFTDNAGAALIGANLRFFQDDSYTGGGEASPGFVDYIRVYDEALSGAQVAALSPPQVGGAGAVPEPATWAMMLMGFFGLGGALRRRRDAGCALA